ncbi:MAG: right-handed parallel beta-helix repeat-containing protein, partial [Bacteroidota bacterium]
MKKMYQFSASREFLTVRKVFLTILGFILMASINPVNGQESVATDPPFEPGNVVNICLSGFMVVSVNNTSPTRYYTLNQTGIGNLQTLPGNGGSIAFNPVSYSAAGSYSHLVVSNDFAFFTTFSASVWSNPSAASLIKNPDATSSEAGTNVSASLGNAGSGGYACSDSYERRTRTGDTWGAWEPYILDALIPTSGLSGVEIRSIRKNNESSRGCYHEQTYSWAIHAYKNISDVPPSTYISLQEAIDAGATTAGEIIEVAPGSYPILSPVNINKAITIRGSGINGTWNSKLTFSGAINCMNISGNNVFIENLEIEKTDKTGPSGILKITADNVTIRQNKIYGHYEFGDEDVSIGFEAAAGSTGLALDLNTIHSLRIAGNFNGSLASPTTGAISNNTAFRTRGWIMDGADMAFTGNLWTDGNTYNVYDIVILSTTNPGYYPDIVAVSNANNDAVIEDQRVIPAVLSVVYTHANATAGGGGGKVYPYKSINDAIARVVPHGKINVSSGSYIEQLTITKSLNLIGSGYWVTYIYPPATRTGTVIQDAATWDYIVAAYAPTGTINVKIEGFSLLDSNKNKMPGTNNLAGLFMRNISGTGAGFYNCYIGQFPQTPEFECFGVRVFGNSLLTIENNTIEAYTGDGIGVTGGTSGNPDVAISNNILYGSDVPLNGIYLGEGASGVISDNYVRDHIRSASGAGSGIQVSGSNGVLIDHNQVYYAERGINLVNADRLTLTENSVGVENMNGFGIVMDNIDSSKIQNNYIVNDAGNLKAGLILSNGSTGNLIGGEEHGNRFMLHTSDTLGDLIGVYLESSVGAANNTFSYNIFSRGKRQFKIDAGVTGTTTIYNNWFGWDAGLYADIVLNGGNAIISNNIFNPNTVRGIIIDGANNVDVRNNTFNYGSSEFAINMVNSTGSNNISGNTFFVLTGTSLIADAGADNFVFNCNTIWGGADTGIYIRSGCTGASITNNLFSYIPNTAIVAHEDLLTVTGNNFPGCTIGIEAWHALTAHENTFGANSSGALIIHSNDNHDVTNNYWGWYGPKIANSTNDNTFYKEYQDTEIQANSFTNFKFVPWLQTNTDFQPDSCGFQPEPGYSFAPVYANADDSALETEQYSSITTALNTTALPYVKAKAGVFNEKLNIDKAMNLKGAGIEQTTIDATLLASGTVVAINVPSGDVLFDGFRLKNSPDQNIMTAVSSSPASVITVNANKFQGNGTAGNHDFGFVTNPGNPAKIILTNNLFENSYNDAVLIEKQLGETEISHNFFHGTFPLISFKTFGGYDVTSHQQVDSNTFYMEAADTTRFGAVISFNSAYRSDSGISLGIGKYSDIEIADNKINDLPHTSNNNYLGIALSNDDPYGIGGEITNAHISRNNIRGYNSANAEGIRLAGLIDSAHLTGNEIRGMFSGIRSLANNNGDGIQYPVNTLVEENAISGNNLAGSTGISVSGGSIAIRHNPGNYYYGVGIDIFNNAEAEVVDNQVIYSLTGIVIRNEANAVLVDNEFSYNLTGIDIRNAANADVIDNAVNRNTTGVSIHDYGSLISCTGNTVSQNSEVGILLDSTSIVNAITGNTISGNGFEADTIHGVGLKNENNDVTVDARYNYWGGWPYFAPYSTCGEGNAIIGRVDFIPIVNYIGGDTLYPPVTNVTKVPPTYYCKIQDAINDADSNDEIHVPSGYYTEQVTITKSLTLTGAGMGMTNIIAPLIRTGSVVQGTETWDYIVAAYAPSGTIDVKIAGLTIDDSWNEKTPGTDNYAGVFFRDVNGAGAGIFKSYISGFPQTPPFVCSGIKVYGNSLLTIDSNYFYYHTAEGIGISSGNVTVSNNTLYGTGVSGNGVVLKATATGSIHDNFVHNHTAIDACGIWVERDSIVINHNQVIGCYNGIKLRNVSGLTVTNNFVHRNLWQGIIMDNVNNSIVQDNGIQDQMETTHANMVLSGGSTGNLIGGDGHGNSFTLHQQGTSGDLMQIYMPASLGAGNNIISHNIFSNGKRQIQIDAGVTGTTVINNNQFGWDAGLYADIVVNGGNALISANGFGSGTIRGIIIDGANNVDINNNSFGYGVPEFAIQLVNASGTKNISQNIFYGLNGPSLIADAGADNLVFNCNKIWYGPDISVELLSGCTGVSITNNLFYYVSNTAIAAHEDLLTVTGNEFPGCTIGIEAWHALTAHENTFANNPSGAMVFYSNDNHNVTNNYWGWYGPKILNSTNNNTYFPEYQGEAIQANNFANFKFVPWLQTSTDFQPDSCGFQPEPGYSFAPVYANTDGSNTETEQYGSITYAVGNTSLPYVIAKAGEFTEQVLIQKDINLIGAGIDVTYIKSPDSGRVTAPGYSGNVYPGSPWNTDYLLAAYPTNPVNGSPISVKVSGFTLHAANKSHIGDRFTGAFFRKVADDTAAKAGISHSSIKGFANSDTVVTGIHVLEGSGLNLGNNLIEGSSTPIIASNSDHILVDSNTVSYTKDGGIALESSHHCTIAANTITDIVTRGIVIRGDNNLIAGNTITDYSGTCNSGIYLFDANNNSIKANTISRIRSGNTDSIGSCGWAIGVAGTSAFNSIGDGTLSNANEITSNDAGVVFAGIGSGNTANGNKIYSNWPHGLNNSGGAAVSAISNWWGSLDGPYNVTLNPCGNGDALTNGNAVAFSPWKNNDAFDHNVYKLVLYNLGGTASMCVNVVANITLSGSQVFENGSDYQYSLYREGYKVYGSEKPGTGNKLTWSVIENYPGEYHFTVWALNMLDGCELEMNGVATLTIAPIPDAAGMIEGPAVVEQGQTGVVYTVSTIPFATGYNWVLPLGATITSGANTNTITVKFAPDASSGSMTVTGTNSCGSGSSSPGLSISVNIAPFLSIGTALITDSKCYNALQTITVAGGGNTFTVANGGSITMIAGHSIIILPTTTVHSGGFMHAYITTTNNFCGTAAYSTVTTPVEREEIIPSLSEASSFFNV